jgi:hypothetical protein
MLPVETSCSEASDVASVGVVDPCVEGIAPMTPIEILLCEGEICGEAPVSDAGTVGVPLVGASGPKSEEDAEEDAGA